MRRRAFLKRSLLLPAAALPLTRALSAGPTVDATVKMLGTPQPFDYAWLKGQARALANQPSRPARDDIPDVLKNLDWDQYQDIRYRPDHALWAKDRLRFRVKFFHLGLFFKAPVRIFEVVDGFAQELAYDPAMFDYGKSGVVGSRLASDQGFAGFNVLYHTDPVRDIIAFLGASYFRAVGGEMQYGISARGLAIDTGMGRPEEFPMFTAFWLERPARDSGQLVVYALLAVIVCN